MPGKENGRGNRQALQRSGISLASPSLFYLSQFCDHGPPYVEVHVAQSDCLLAGSVVMVDLQLMPMTSPIDDKKVSQKVSPLPEK